MKNNKTLILLLSLALLQSLSLSAMEHAKDSCATHKGPSSTRLSSCCKCLLAGFVGCIALFENEHYRKAYDMFAADRARIANNGPYWRNVWHDHY